MTQMYQHRIRFSEVNGIFRHHLRSFNHVHRSVVHVSIVLKLNVCLYFLNKLEFYLVQLPNHRLHVSLR